MKIPLEILERFKSALAGFQPAGKTLRVALSGGSDSVALCQLLAETGGDFCLAALHVNHGLREEAAEDEAFARRFCGERGIPLEVRNADVRGRVESGGEGEEEAARNLRYRIFSEFTETGELVATGHTADDAVETLLFNLVRGTGPRGLAGIPKRRGGVIRPLLDFSRRELKRWLRARDIEWRSDESNLDLRYSRNRIRWMLIPEIRRVFGDGAIRRLHREADIFAACADFIERRGGELAEKSLVAEYESVRMVDAKLALAGLWDFGEILRLSAEELGTGLSGIGFDTVDRLFESARSSRRGRRYPAAGGLHIECGDRLLIFFSDIKSPDPRKISVPGEF